MKENYRAGVDSLKSAKKKTEETWLATNEKKIIDFVFQYLDEHTSFDYVFDEDNIFTLEVNRKKKS